MSGVNGTRTTEQHEARKADVLRKVRKQRAKAEQKIIDAQVFGFWDFVEGFHELYPVESEALDKYMRGTRSQIAQELESGRTPEDFKQIALHRARGGSRENDISIAIQVLLVSAYCVGKKNPFTREVEEGTLWGAQQYASEAARHIIFDNHYFNLERSNLYSQIYRDLLPKLVSFYETSKEDCTASKAILKAELAGTYRLPPIEPPTPYVETAVSLKPEWEFAGRDIDVPAPPDKPVEPYDHFKVLADRHRQQVQDSLPAEAKRFLEGGK